MSEGALDDAGRLLARRVGLRLDPAIRGRLARAVRDEAKRLDDALGEELVLRRDRRRGVAGLDDIGLA